VEDSAEKTPEQSVKPTVSEEIILRQGEPVKVIRGGGGKFQRQPKAMPSSREFTRVTRNYMLNMEVGKDGKMLKGSQTKYQMMVENLICIARGVDTVLPNGDTVARDSKADMAAAQAFKIVTERGLGQAPKSDEEMEAGKTQGVKMVIVLPPDTMMNKMVIEDAPRPSLKPAFIEGEFTENKT
jgi:hypothetical protein